MATQKDPREIRKSARKSARAGVKKAKQQARTYKKGARIYARGERQEESASNASARQRNRAMKKGSLSGTRKSTRYKAMDAQVKKETGSKMMDNAYKGTSTPKKTKAYRDARTHGRGANAYVSRAGKNVVRKKRR